MTGHRHNASGIRSAGRVATATTELAVILPVLLLLVLGAGDFGRFAYTYVSVTNAARAGGAYATMNPFTSGTQDAWQAAVQNAARQEMAGQPGFVATDLAVTCSETIEATRLRQVTVETSYPFHTLIDWPGIPSSMTLHGKVVMRVIR